MSGKLYVVGTPIGNLGDFSPRAIETLENVDFIAAEDTRVTLKLLNNFGIKKDIFLLTEIYIFGKIVKIFPSRITITPFRKYKIYSGYIITLFHFLVR